MSSILVVIPGTAVKLPTKTLFAAEPDVTDTSVCKPLFGTVLSVPSVIAALASAEFKKRTRPVEVPAIPWDPVVPVTPVAPVSPV